MKLMFIGPPGAGKGTQAQRICQRYHIPHISTGDILRAERKAKTPLGVAAQGYIDRGDLVPDDVIIGIVKNRLEQDDCIKGFLFDGFPRTVAQADALAAITALDRVINIFVPSEKLVQRAISRRVCEGCGFTTSTAQTQGGKCPQCGQGLIQRPDDREETVSNRLSVYEKQTQPLLEYYKKAGVLAQVDGDASMDSVTEAIAAVIEGKN